MDNFNIDIFKVLTTALITIGIYILKDFKSTLEKLQESVSKLNASISLLTERSVNNKEILDDLKERVDRNERDIEKLKVDFASITKLQ